MTASASTYQYGPTGIGGGATRAPARSAPIPFAPSDASAVLRRTVRRAWDEEPALERTRRALQREAARAGIAGATGTYGEAARRTGFSDELRRIAGPKEIGALASLYRSAWGQLPGPLQP